MNEEQIVADRQRRVAECKKKIDDALQEFELDLVSEGSIGDQIKISCFIQLKDVKVYPDADVAQPASTKVPIERFLEDLDGPGDKI